MQFGCHFFFKGHRTGPVLLLLCLALSWPAAASALVLNSGDAPTSLSQAIEILEDPDGKLTIDDLGQPANAKRFVPWSKPQDVNIGFSGSAWWFRVPLSRDGQASMNWLLEIPYTYNRKLDFYAPGKPPVLTGSDRSIASRPIFHPHYIFPIQLSTDVRYFYFRAESSYAISLPLVAWQPVAFYKESTTGFFVQAMYYGAILILVLYNLALSISLRDRRFLLYVGFAFFMCVGVFAGNGMARLVLWPEWERFDEIAGTFFITVSTIFSVLFSLQFLQTKTHAPRVAIGMHGLVIALVLVAAMQLAGIWYSPLVGFAFKTVSFLALILFAGLLTASYQAVHARVPGILLFITAWSVFWAGGLVATLRVFDLIPTNSLTSYALQISSAIEMTLFAFALAEMIKIEKRERINAQSALLEAKQELLDNMRSHEAHLERTIEERTRELNIALRKEKELLGQYVRFGSLISHEFRNPLGVINSQATLLKKEQRLDMTGEDRITAIKTAVRRLVKLFDKWLEGDRLETLLQHKMSAQSVAARPWLDQLLRKNASLFENHQIIVGDDPARTMIYADVDMLEIAMLNLLENACKYSSPHSRIVVAIAAEKAGSGFSVTDEGIGISESQQDEIFNDYVRLDQSGQPGLGLGLAFVKRIMLAHGGSIQLNSTPGLGSSFKILFPFQAAAK